MLTSEAHYGGAFHAGSGSFVLGWHSKRVIRANPTVAIFATLPSAPVRFDQKYLGRPAFIIINDGTASINVVDQLSNTIITLAASKWAAIGIGEQWQLMMTGSVSQPLNASSYRVESQVPYITSACETPTFDPFCAENICEFVNTIPLNGENDTTEVLAPFYQDVTVHAKNSNREAIRACDCVMSKHVTIRLKDGDFSKDASHPLSGQSLSEYFFDALYNRKTVGSAAYGSEPHMLEYEGKEDSYRASDWHHNAYLITLSGEGWNHGAPAAQLMVRKYFWSKKIQYGPPDSPTAHNLELLFIMEHKLNNAVRFDPEDVGGVGDLQDGNNHERGLWGALFTLAIFTDEIEKTFGDGDKFQPYGWQDEHPFYRKDPCVSGNAYEVRDTETVNTYKKRGVHPQCVALAHLPTTFHAPMGRMLSSQANNEKYLVFQGDYSANARNLDDCLLVPNGSPWIDTTQCQELNCPCKQSSWPNANWGIMENIVFGHPGSMGKGMTLGGDMKESLPMEWLCWVNSENNPNGLTWLKVNKPGWDDLCGNLTVSKGNSGEIWLCVIPHLQQLDELGYDLLDAVSRCDGHPSEPYQGIGGSHTCFRTASGAQPNKRTANDKPLVAPKPSKYLCCIPTINTTVRAHEMCYITTTTYGDWTGAEGCELISQDCQFSRWYWRQWRLLVTQYTYMPNGNADLREISWSRILPNPNSDYALRDWNYLSTDSNLSAVLGGITKTATGFTFSSVSGTNPIRACASYDKPVGIGPTTFDWFGCDIECRFKGVNAGPLGIGFLDSSQNGYGLNVVSSGSDLIMQLCRYSQNTKAVLASYTFAGQGTNVEGDARFRIHGTDLLVSYKPDGQSINTITKVDGVEWMRQGFVARVPDKYDPANDSFSNFLPSFYTEHTSSGLTINKSTDPMIRDLVPNFINHYGFAGKGTVSTTLHEEDFMGYGACDGTSGDPNCGNANENSVSCNCIIQEADMKRFYTATHAGASDILSKSTFSNCYVATETRCPSNAPWTEGNPQYHGGPNPYRCVCESTSCVNYQYGCDNECPPWENVYIEFPLPTSKTCWDGRGDPSCVGSIPLLCNGIDLYYAEQITCD